jgi:hypothetical protein
MVQSRGVNLAPHDCCLNNFSGDMNLRQRQSQLLRSGSGEPAKARPHCARLG